MKVIIKILFVLTFLVALVFGVLLFFYYQQNEQKKENEISPTVTPTIDPSTPAPIITEIDEFTYGAWMPNWASSAGLASLEKQKNILSEISPVWYEVNTDGSLKNLRPKEAAKITSLAKQNDIKIIPAIGMMDHEILSLVLQNPENLERHVNSIVSVVEEHDYDGIDLDYESTKLADKELYFEFLEKLSTELHNREKLLYVTVLAKWGDDIYYPSLPETREVQDWWRISMLADQIRIMTYDYTYSKARFPGPIAPVSWMQDVVNYALENVDNSKLVLGIHLYSYEWYSTNEADLAFQPSMDDNDSSDKAVRSYTYNTILGVLKNFKGETIDYEGEKIFSYKKGSEFRTLVYIDPAGVQERIKLAKDNNFKGVVFWRLGEEGNQLSSINGQ